MKKTFYSLFAFVLIIINSNEFFCQNNFTVKAQEDNAAGSYNGLWGGLDVGILMTNASNEWENNVGSSAVVGFNAFEYKIPFYKQFLGFTTGLGFNLRTYSFNNQYSLVSNDSSVYLATGNPTLYDPNSTIRYSQLNQGFMQVPLLLDFSTKQRQEKAISFAAGIIGGIRLYSTHRLNGKYSNNDKFNIVVRDDKRFHTNMFSLDVTFRAAYGSFGIFGAYSLTNLFNKNTSNTVLNPISFGVSFNVDYIEKDKD